MTSTKPITTEQPTTEQSVTTEKITEVATVALSEYVPNGKTPQLMLDVLLNKTEFIFVETDFWTNEKVAVWNKILSEFNYSVDRFMDYPVQIIDYRVIDLDADGYNEVILNLVANNDLILHYEDNKVYGFMYSDRGMLNIYTSGIFEGSFGAANTVYSIMDFHKDSFEVTDVVGWHDGKYYIEGKETTREEVKKYKSNDKFKYAIPRYTDLESLLDID